MEHSFNKKKRLHLISTGGTIEKTYDESEGSLHNRTSTIKDKLAQRLRLPYLDIELTVLMAKDSLLLEDQDRQQIFEAIKSCLDSRCPVVILHGTDTMSITLNYCFNRLPELPSTVIFTGAMRPLEFEDSDALQNVTEALFAAQLAAPGWYISFHSRLYSPPNVRKNHVIGSFEEFDSQDL